MTTQLRDGSTTEDPRLDRLVSYDERSRGYSVGHLRAEARPERRGRGWTPGPVLDQGSIGACVSYSAHARRNGAPVKLRQPITDRQALLDFYYACQRRDPWEGGEYEGASPRYSGTSVLAGMQEGQDRGWWESYWWVGAGSGDVLADVVYALGHLGGVLLGIPWLRSMMQPRPSGLLEVDPASGVVGGHAIYLTGLRLKMRLPREWSGTREVVVPQQSWGDWGIGYGSHRSGFCYMLLDDLGWLLENQGEGAVPLELKP